MTYSPHSSTLESMSGNLILVENENRSNNESNNIYNTEPDIPPWVRLLSSSGQGWSWSTPFQPHLVNLMLKVYSP